MKAPYSVSFRTLLLALFLLFLAPSVLLAEQVGQYIRISKIGAQKIPLVLKPLDIEKRGDARYAVDIDSVIRSGLDFTGLFTLIKPPLNIIAGGNLYQVGSRKVNFAALTSVGAEVYAGGVLEKKGGTLEMNMEVYDALTGRLLLKKLYQGGKDDVRSLAHRFCGDLVRLLTGKPSIFGSKIAYVSARGGKKEVYLADFDGYGARQVTSTGGLALTPALSPDGRYLAYLTYTRGRSNLHIKDLSSQKIIPVTRKGTKIDPAWRGRSQLATTFSFDGDQELYLVGTNGAISRRLTRSSGIDVSPSFSPDGGQMAFVSSRHGNPQIFIQDLNSGSERRLTFSGKYNTQPSWSPEGNKIAFTTMQNSGEINIFVINADGTGLRQLTYGSRHNEAPSWSPDGTMLVFSSDRNGRKELFVMNADGRNQRSLKLSGEQMQPCWSSFK